jgi:hypothetical protein
MIYRYVRYKSTQLKSKLTRTKENASSQKQRHGKTKKLKQSRTMPTTKLNNVIRLEKKTIAI